ncbi:hypothetical protein KAH02_06160 [bacterium]|nr:hypothetical protein [bacterium]
MNRLTSRLIESVESGKPEIAGNTQSLWVGGLTQWGGMDCCKGMCDVERGVDFTKRNLVKR